jgi:hypothetical protein
MLTVVTIPFELYDEEKNTFINIPGGETLLLEHSLISVSKWEARWHRAFLSPQPRSDPELEDYIGRCMRITNKPDVDSSYMIERLSEDDLERIQEYILDSASATFLPKSLESRSGTSQAITSELIYYWMIALQIPFECEKWHLNRLLTLINVCNIKNQPKKKINPSELARRNTELNAARRAKLNSSG